MGSYRIFARYPVMMSGKQWPTSEHYFQAQKFSDDAVRAKIRRAGSPSIAAQIGRDRRNPLRCDWESVKVQLMRDVVLAKFSQHETLRELLLETGNAELVERTDRDSFWGDGGDGSGKNMLGRILMEVRDTLRMGNAV